MADEEVPGPHPGRPPGWYPAGTSPNEQVQWDGQHWVARRRWVHSAWVDVPMDADEVRPTPSTHVRRRRPRDRRWSPTAVVLLVLALAGLGGLIFALLSGVNSAPASKSTTAPPATTAPASKSTSAPPATTAPSAPSAATVRASPTTTPTTTGISIQPAAEAEVAACQSDAKSVEMALATFQAQQGHYPAPPSPWSATTYANDYLPLTSASGGGPYLAGAPTTTHYVVEYDSSGHVWITPPGAYDAYDPGQDFGTSPNVCLAAVG